MVVEKLLDFAHRQAAPVEGQHFVIEARESTRVFGNELRLERAVATTRHLNRDRPIVGQDAFSLVPLR